MFKFFFKIFLLLINPLRPASVYPRLCCGGRTDSPGGEGDGRSIFWKTREIRLPSYSKICTLWVICFDSSPILSRRQVVSLSQSSCVSPVELTYGERGERRWGRSRERESLAFYKLFTTLWTATPPPPPPPHALCLSGVRHLLVICVMVLVIGLQAVPHATGEPSARWNAH